MTLVSVFLILALILFVTAAAGVPSRVNLTAAGLACLTVAVLLSELG
jgi:hypothetical protein